MKAMTVVRVCLAVAALGVLVLVFASAWPPLDLRGFAVVATMVLPVAILTYVGAVARHLLAQATGVDITWPLLLLSLFTFGIFYWGVLTPPGPDGCYTVESASEMKSVSFKLWVAWSALAFLGFGAAISKNDSFSRLAGFVFPLAIAVVVGALLGLALGHPVLCYPLEAT